MRDFDTYDDYEMESDSLNASRPTCACCGEPIVSDKAYDIDGLYCQACFDYWVESVQVYMD